MKIGIDARTLMDKNYSGVAECTFNLVKNIAKINNRNKDYQIKLFYNSGVDIKEKLPQFEGTEQIYTKYPNKIFNYFLQKIFHFPAIDKLLGVDLFFMPHFNFAFISRAKKVLVVHDISFLRYPSFFNFRKNFWHKMLNVKKIIKTSDKVIAISENTKKDIIDIVGIKDEKIEVIHNGIDSKFRVVDKNSKNLREVKKKYKLPDKFVLYLGTIEPRKNIESIISSFSEFLKKEKDAQLLIVGQIGWSSKNIMKFDRRMKNRVKFLGYIPQIEKVYIYNLASVFIFPSFYEGFGLPPLEAMACGTPVITSNVSSLPEVVKNNAIMVNPYDKQDIVIALNNLYKDDELYNLLSEKGALMAKDFKWENVAKKYLYHLQLTNTH